MFGLQYEQECFCGYYNDYGSHGSVECDASVDCTDPETKFFGENKNCIFSINEIDVQVSGFTFVGCYADKDEDRDLPMLMEPQWHYYDKDSCYQACSKAGYGKIVRIPMPPCAYPILI